MPRKGADFPYGNGVAEVNENATTNRARSKEAIPRRVIIAGRHVTIMEDRELTAILITFATNDIKRCVRRCVII